MGYMLGIDTGFDGGLALLNDSLELVDVLPMPILRGVGSRKQYDVSRLVDYLCDLSENNFGLRCTVERTQVTPIAGKNSCYGMGYGLGLIEGILCSLGIPYKLVSARVWGASVFKGLSGDTKQKSIQFVSHAYPAFDFHRTPRCTKIHDGMTDAVCIAYYGWGS